MQYVDYFVWRAINDDLHQFILTVKGLQHRVGESDSDGGLLQALDFVHPPAAIARER